MKGVAEIGVLASEIGSEDGEFGVDESAGESGKTAENPSAEDEGGGVNFFGDNVRVDENAGANDAAHDDHGGVENSELRASDLDLGTERFRSQVARSRI